MPLAGNSVVLIAGPTASGKSTAALALAERVGGTIINADSMQVYAGLRVLTARPSEAEEARAPHKLYGLVDPAEAYSVGRWVEAAAAAIATASAAGSVPIVVGGSGLYFHALTTGLAPIPDVPEDIRRRWRDRAESVGAAGLHADLAARDPGMAERLLPSDPQRLIRALEVLDATGTSLSEWQVRNGVPVVPRDRAIRIVMAPERETLYATIDARFERMLNEGALEEVEALTQRALDPGLPVMRALGVRPLMAFLSGDSSREDAILRAQTDSRRYAKRQLTWARQRMADWTWMRDPLDTLALSAKLG